MEGHEGYLALGVGAGVVTAHQARVSGKGLEPRLAVGLETSLARQQVRHEAT